CFPCGNPVEPAGQNRRGLRRAVDRGADNRWQCILWSCANGRRVFVSDIFNEVDEEVRREQLKKLWERYGNYLIAVCVLVVVGVGAWRGYEWGQGKQA